MTDVIDRVLLPPAASHWVDQGTPSVESDCLVEVRYRDRTYFITALWDDGWEIKDDLQVIRWARIHK